MTGVGDHSWPQHSRCIQAGGPSHPDRVGSPCPAELPALRPNKERSDLPSLWKPTLRIGQRIPGVSPFLALLITTGELAHTDAGAGCEVVDSSCGKSARRPSMKPLAASAMA